MPQAINLKKEILVQPLDPSNQVQKLYTDLWKGKNIPNVRLIARDVFTALGYVSFAGGTARLILNAVVRYCGSLATGGLATGMGISGAVMIGVVGVYMGTMALVGDQSEFAYFLQRKIALFSLKYLMGMEQAVSAYGATQASLKPWKRSIVLISMNQLIWEGALLGAIKIDATTLGTEYRRWQDSVIQKMRLVVDRNPAAPAA